MPVGPTTLWPVKASRSAPLATTSTGSCGAAWDASTTTIAPTSCARRAISATGLIVPSMFDTQVSETTLVRSVIRSSMFDRSSRPSSVSPNQRSRAPLRSVRSCHGTMLEWCSISVMTTSSPAPMARSPVAHASVFATRLSASEAFFVKITSSRLGALMKRRHLVPGVLERLGRLRAELVHGPGDVRVVPLEVVDHRVDHHLRLLRGVGAVEVDQGLPARERAREDGEVLAQDLQLGQQAPWLRQHHAQTPALTYLS